jgi:GNAT superfamily N-acetyltransferase
MEIPEFIVEPTDASGEQDSLQSFLAQALSDPSMANSALPAGQYAVARHSLSNSQILGVIAINCSALVKHSSQTSFAMIELLVVAPDRRREGIACALLQWASDNARTHQALALRCDLPASKFALTALASNELEACLQKFAFKRAANGVWSKLLAFATAEARIEQHAQVQPVRAKQAIGGKTSTEARAATLQVIALTQRDLVIYTRDLDPVVLNTQVVLDSLRLIALKPGAKLRFLVQNTERALRDGHRLLELSRRLPSNFEFRCVQAEDLQYAGAFVVNDQRSFLTRAFAERFECEGELYDIAESNRLRRYFDEVWERSRIATEWRRLSL